MAILKLLFMRVSAGLGVTPQHILEYPIEGCPIDFVLVQGSITKIVRVIDIQCETTGQLRIS